MLAQRLIVVFLSIAAFLFALGVRAQQAPNALIESVSNDVLVALKADRDTRTDVRKISALVDAKVMPHVNFRRMTASAVGRYWRQATPEQKARLQEEFQTLLVRTYSGALSQINEQTVITLKPMRSSPEDKQVAVRTEVRGQGDSIQLDYRLEKSDEGWKIYDVNVLGVWLVQNYRNSFAQEIGANGIDGLINKMAAKNMAVAAKEAAKESGTE